MADPSELPGAIGAEIDGPSSTQVQQDSKAKKFFTDPKNLATMLVMAAAVSQPRQGRSVVGHTLRSGVGALGFRGGLDAEITSQQQTAAEAGSVIEGREATAENNAERNAVLGEQVAGTKRGQDIGVTEGVLDRASAEKIAGIKAAAVAQDDIANKMLLEGLKGYHTAMNLHLANPQLISRPNIKDFMPVLPPGYSLDEILPPAEEVAIVDPENPTTPTAKVDRGPDYGGLALPASNARSLRKDLPAERITQVVTKTTRRKFPDETGDLSDESLMSAISQIQDITTMELKEGMSQERAKQVRQDKFKYEMLTRDQQKEVARIARGPIDIKTPGAL